MAKEKNQNFEEDHRQKWKDEDEQHPFSSIEEASTISNQSSSSFTCCSSSSSSSSYDTADDDDDDDDASSANSSRSSLYDLSDLMSHLPIKGLSKFYHGKSDSFTSLAQVTSIEDLPKNKSLNNNMKKKKKKINLRSYTLLPKPVISKKKSRNKNTLFNIINKDLK